MPQDATAPFEVKQLSLEIKADAAGVIEGYGSVFGGVDAYGDTIEPGAFTESLKTRKPKMLWQHRMDAPIGVWDEVAEDGTGLRMRGRLAKTALAQEARELAGMGALDGLSIGFRTVLDEMRGNNRVIKRADLYEVSLVTIPADKSAVITAVKSLLSPGDIEGALRGIGFSRAEAKAFIARGWGGVRDLRDAETGLPDDVLREAEAVKTQLATLLERIGK